jgi:membrane-bound ClpP family serine protease
MIWVILLFSLGIVFIALEVGIPGAVLGIIGAVLIFTAIAIAFALLGPGGGLITLLVGGVLACIAFYLQFKVLPKTRLGRRAFLTKAITSVSAPVPDAARDLIGKTAEALTLLSPTGYIRVEGQRYEAFCETGQVPAGAELQVVGADNFRLIVTPLPQPS